MTRPHTKLSFQTLEDRFMPTVFGTPWADAHSLTLSFANDNVLVSNIPGTTGDLRSTLYQKLNATIPTKDWQFQVLRAFQTWAEAADINISVVTDNNANFGEDNYDYSRTQSGQLRIGAIPLSSEVAAITTPYHVLSGMRAGDVLLNTTTKYDIGGKNGSRDLYTVSLNEAANALGLDDNTDSTSARYGRYTTVRTGISSKDRTSIINMYGARKNDLFDQSSANNTLATASSLLFLPQLTNLNARIAVALGSIATKTDIDSYKFTTPSGTTSLNINLKTSGFSSFTGKVEVYNNAQQLIATRTVTDPLNGDVYFSVLPVTGNTNYFVRVTPSRTDMFAVGTYRLAVGANTDPRPYIPQSTVNFTDFGSDNGSDNNTPRLLTNTTPGFNLGTKFTSRGVIENSTDTDLYKFVALPVNGNPLTVTVTPIVANSFKPEVHVYTANFVWVQPTKLTQNTSGRWVAQFHGIPALSVVHLRVRNIDGTTGTGAYEMIADYNTPRVDLKTLSEGYSNRNFAKQTIALDVPESTIFHFGVETWNATWVANPGTAGRSITYIVDSAGKIVMSLLAENGLATKQVFLPKGRYKVIFHSVDSQNYLLGGASFKFSAARISDPIDVYDPNDTGNQTPPVIVVPEPEVPEELPPWFISDPWSDPIGG